HGSHKQATPDQLPSPTAGSRPQIHRLVTQANPLLPLLFREQGQEGFVQLESGTAWRLMGKLQPHNPVMMDGAIVRCAVAHEYPTGVQEKCMPPSTARILGLGQQILLTQALSQRSRKLLAKCRPLLAWGGVRRLDPEMPETYLQGTKGRQRRGDPIGFRQVVHHRQ